MDGSVDKERVLVYLSKLLNKSLSSTEAVSLTSGQRARLSAWLTTERIPFNSDSLLKLFSAEELCDLRGRGNSVGVKEMVNSAPSMAPKINGIIGLGVDIQRINELFPDELPEDLKSDLHLGEIFSQRELSYAASKPNPRQTLAGIYSAKEAIVKSGSNFSDYSHIQIEHSASGQPFSTGYMVSISHSGEYVISIALMLGN